MTRPSPRLHLPKDWPRSVQAAILHVIALAQYALAYTRGWAADHANARVRLAAQSEQARQEAALLREEGRIKDARMARIPAAKRPHYLPTERLAILEVRAARGWSLAQTADVFQVTTATIAAWCKRLDEGGADALLQTRAPVNRFPDFVRYVVQRLQMLCPHLGKVKIAQVLARAGLHLAVSTVGRMRRAAPVPDPKPQPQHRSEPMPSARRVTAKYPNHVWHVDLTTVPIMGGFWVPWLPFALPQCWPFCWWLAVAIDHYSRCAVGFALFREQPTSKQVRQFLGRVIANVGAVPKYLVSDSGGQFTSLAFAAWCRRRGIRQRRGAVGKSGSIAVIERFIGTLKREGTRLLRAIPLSHRAFQYELSLFVRWYNEARPHTTLDGATPDERFFGRRPACRQPRFEPRPGWPRASPCAAPPALVKGQPGVALQLHIEWPGHRRHLPRVTVTRVA